MDNRRKFLQKTTAVIAGSMGNFAMAGSAAASEAVRITTLNISAILAPAMRSNNLTSRLIQSLFTTNPDKIDFITAAALINSANGHSLEKRKKDSAIAMRIRRMNLSESEITALIDNIFPLKITTGPTGHVYSNESTRKEIFDSLTELNSYSIEGLKTRLSRLIAKEESFISACREFCNLHGITVADSPLEYLGNNGDYDIKLNPNVKVMTFPDMASAAKVMRGYKPEGVNVIIFDKTESGEGKPEKLWVEKIARTSPALRQL